MTWHDELAALHPCKEALEWATQYPTAQAAWEACERGDWMLWYAARVGLTPERHRQMVAAACEIARGVLHLVPAGETRPLAAIEAAEAWAENPTPGAASAAAWAAARAAWAAWAAWAAGPAEAAAWPAEVAAWAAGPAEAAAWPAEVAAWAAAMAAGAAEVAAWAAALNQFADIVRRHLSCP